MICCAKRRPVLVGCVTVWLVWPWAHPSAEPKALHAVCFPLPPFLVLSPLGGVEDGGPSAPAFQAWGNPSGAWSSGFTLRQLLWPGGPVSWQSQWWVGARQEALPAAAAAWPPWGPLLCAFLAQWLATALGCHMEQAGCPSASWVPLFQRGVCCAQHCEGAKAALYLVICP